METSTSISMPRACGACRRCDEPAYERPSQIRHGASFLCCDPCEDQNCEPIDFVDQAKEDGAWDQLLHEVRTRTKVFVRGCYRPVDQGLALYREDRAEEERAEQPEVAAEEDAEILGMLKRTRELLEQSKEPEPGRTHIEMIGVKLRPMTRLKLWLRSLGGNGRVA